MHKEGCAATDTSKKDRWTAARCGGRSIRRDRLAYREKKTRKTMKLTSQSGFAARAHTQARPLATTMKAKGGAA
jgi:hypothetical protein